MTSIAGELPVVGVDDDGAGGLWIAYRRETGGYYELADVRVVHRDAAGVTRAEFRYMDEYTQISGLAFSGEAVWLSYNAVGAGNNLIRKLDPVTGEVIGSFATEGGIIDIEAGEGTLVLSNLWNQVIVLDRATGGELDRTPISGSVIEDSTQRGIAVEGDRYWLSAQMDADTIRIVDRNGNLVARAFTDRLCPGWSYERGLQLAWDGTHLIVAHDNQISWLLPENQARRRDGRDVT